MAEIRMADVIETIKVVGSLPELLYAKRMEEGLSLAQASAQAGVSVNTFFRAEYDLNLLLSNVLKLLRWVA